MEFFTWNSKLLTNSPNNCLSYDWTMSFDIKSFVNSTDAYFRKMFLSINVKTDRLPLWEIWESSLFTWRHSGLGSFQVFIKKILLREWEDKPQTARKYLQETYLIKDYITQCIQRAKQQENKQSDLEMGKRSEQMFHPRRYTNGK